MDVFFLSYRESNCETNWQRVLELHPNAMRIHGVSGIDKVHMLCDSISSSEYFWTVDGDNYLLMKLEYTEKIENDLLMFSAIDPLSNTSTFLGGVKLWKKNAMNADALQMGDFSLNATANKKTIEKNFSISKYNQSPFDAWKTAFRHCVKLTSILLANRPNAKNINHYLKMWSQSNHSAAENSQWAYNGYLDALEYTATHKDNKSELLKINDYAWLSNMFNEKYETS